MPKIDIDLVVRLDFKKEKGMELTASCCCESAGVITQGEPVINSLCHCENCKKRTGSAFGISVYFKNEQIVKYFGETVIYTINNEIKQERHFCKNCGTTIYWKLSSIPDYIGVAGGCFNADLLPDPVYTLSNDNKFSWLALSGNFRECLENDVFK